MQPLIVSPYWDSKASHWDQERDIDKEIQK